MKKSLFYISCLFAAPLVMAACLVDPMTNPVASSPFGKFRSSYGSTVHQGFDLVPSGKKNSKGTELFSAAKGKIAWAGFRGNGYGNMVAVERTDEQAGDIVLYRHMRHLFPKAKESLVNPGDFVGYMSGTGNSHNDHMYAEHLHLEYMTKKANAVQYEFNPDTKKTAARFVNIGHKNLGDIKFIGRGLYYTDPAPYFCNTFRFQSAELTGKFKFKDTKEQYQFMMTKLGKQGISAGNPPSISDYSAAQQGDDAEKSCQAVQADASLG